MQEHFYIEVEGNPVPATLMEWGSWSKNIDNRRVASDYIGEVHVSTVFIGMDQGFGQGPPLLYETMVFRGPMDGEIDRYSTREEALRGHQEMLNRVKAGEPVTKEKP